MQRQLRGDRQGEEEVDEQPQPPGVIDVAGPVRGHEHVPARLDPGAVERRRVGQRARLEEQRDVDHHITDELDAAGRVLALEVRDRCLRRAQQQVGEVIGQDAVELLGHRAVERPHPRLDMSHGDARLRRGEPARERRVRIAVDEQHIRPLGRQQRPECGEHARGLLRVRAAVDPELTLRPRDAELLDEHGAELVVVVLAGVDEQLVVLGAQRARDRRRLDELRPVPDDGDDAQALVRPRRRQG